MFGKNDIVGKKFFKDADGKLLVTSVFMTLQGEGPFRGEPAVFVRLAMCNLACSFCDTYFNSGDWYTVEQLKEKIDQVVEAFFANDTPKWATFWMHGDEVIIKRKMGLVITGGEPMLQDALVPFLEHMHRFFNWIQIESNGTQHQNIPSATTLVVSPKCSEKKGKSIKYLEPNEKVLERADCLKFVMCADLDSPYSSIPDWALNWRDITEKPVFISPMNIYNSEPMKSKQLRSTKNDISIDERSSIDEVISFWDPGLLNMAENQKNHEYAAKYCVQHGLNLNLQIHLYASLA